MDTERVLSQAFLKDHPSDAARVLERLAPQETATCLSEISPQVAANVLRRVVSPHAAECLTHLFPERFALIVAALPLDVTANLLRRLDIESRDRLLVQASSEVSTMLQPLLRYPAGSAGGLMDPKVMMLPADITASEALTRVRRAPRHTLYYLYVVDRNHRLAGVLNLRELMLAEPRASLASVMRRQVITISARADRAAIVAHPGWREVHALPVVDMQGVLLGALRYETLRQLEAPSEGPNATADALSTVLTLGELCWVGLASVLTDLTTSLIFPSRTAKARKEPSNG
jgi:magnesium transporter